MVDKTSKSNCRKCSRATNHGVLFETTHEAEHSWFSELHTWQVLRCLGCETIGFRYRFDDFDNVEELPSGKTKHAVHWERYPNAIAGHRDLDHLHAVPDLIRQVYRQTLKAYAGGALILAGMGFRATIEAVCNYLNVSGSALDKRIDALFKNGHISSSDKKRLHAIRFLGNDAAHEVREPTRAELQVTLDIVEHLINSVFILGYKAKNMDLPVETFEEFKELLASCASQSDSEQPQSLASILGKHRRRVGADLPNFDLTLVKAVHLGTIKFLELTSEEMIEGKPVQLYRIVKGEFEDEVPF